MTRPNLLARAVSWLVRWYCEKFPIQRGKWKLRLIAQPLLVARLEDGPWIRISGVSGQEWDWLLHKQKEQATTSIYKSLLSPGKTVLDVGANVGCYSLIAADRVGAAGRVIAFEPTPSVIKRLNDNIRLNGFTNISVFEGVVSDQEGTCTFHLNPEVEGTEGNSVIETLVAPGATSITCRQTTLDAEIARINLKQVDVLKIDVEGNEVKVLRGARQLLTTYAPQILLEVNPFTLAAGGSSPAELYAELEKQGYTWRIIEQMAWKGTTVLNIHAFHTVRPQLS